MAEWSCVHPLALRVAGCAAAVALLLALSAALAAWRGWRGVREQCVPGAARFLTLGIVLFALSAPTRRQSEARQPAFVFVLDDALRLRAVQEQNLAFIESAAHALPADSRCGVLLAGDDTLWLATPGSHAARLRLQRPELSLTLAPGYLPAALDKACQALSPGDCVVLLTDGWSSTAALPAAGRRIAERGLRLAVLPVAGGRSEGVILEKLAGPVLARADDEVSYLVTLNNTAQRALSVTLELARIGPDGSRAPLEPLTLECAPGCTTVEQRVKLAQTGSQWVAARVQLVDAQPDEFAAHASALCATLVRPTPEILLIGGRTDATRRLAEALCRARSDLASHGLVVHDDAAALPSRVEELERYGAIALVNVPLQRRLARCDVEHTATPLEPLQVEALRRYVSETGGGLVVYGGDMSFELGGYTGSALEAILPVDSTECHEEREKLTYGLLFVLDISGSMVGSLDDAKRAASALISAVPVESQVGLIAFDAQARTILPLSPLLKSSRDALLDAINALTDGGGTRLTPALREAQARVRAVGPNSGHVLVLSDGGLEPDTATHHRLADELRKAGWPVTCIGLGDAPNAATLQAVASAGGGSYRRYPEIPRLGKDDSTDALMRNVSRRAGEPIFESSGLAPGVVASVADCNRVLPALKPWAGASLTFDSSEHPIALAYGNLGLGKSLACLYAIDSSAWSRGLLEGENRDRLLVQPVLHALRSVDLGLVLADLERRPDGSARLCARASDDAAPELAARLESLGADGATSVELRLARTESHLYTAQLRPAPAPDAVLQLVVAPRRGKLVELLPESRAPVTTRVPIDVASLSRSDPNVHALEDMAALTRGRVIAVPQDVRAPTTAAIGHVERRWWNGWIAAAVLIAIAADIATRAKRLGWSALGYAGAAACAYLSLHVA